MALFLLIVGYLLSIVLCSVFHRLASPKYLGILDKYDSEYNPMWIIPLLNTIIVLFLGAFVLIVFICMLCDKLIKKVRINIRFKWLDNFITKFKNEDL